MHVKTIILWCKQHTITYNLAKNQSSPEGGSAHNGQELTRLYYNDIRNQFVAMWMKIAIKGMSIMWLYYLPHVTKVF